VENGIIKIADFGFAKINNGVFTNVVGTEIFIVKTKIN
jgi:hypothetical protein